MSLKGFIIISGIFGKSRDLDILPPPPPFPDIGIGKKPKDAVEEDWKQGKQKRREDRKMKIEFEKQKSIEKRRGEEQGKKHEEMQKKLLEKQRKNDAKKEKIKIPRPIRETDEAKIELPKPEQKKSFFSKLFGKKDEELEKELEEFEEMKPWPKEPRLITKKLPELKIPEAKVKVSKPMREKIEPIKDISEIKLPEMEIEESVKPIIDLEKAQEEIRKSIESMQREKKEPSIGRLFRKKEKEKVMEKIETPEIMPRTFDKIDHVQEIEERVHKARMCLMDFKFDDAKRAYMEIMRLYNSLRQKDRYKVYQDIKDLYYERKSAEKFAKV